MAREDVPLAARRLVLPPPDDAGFEVRRDLEFAGADGMPLTMDLYRPRSVSPGPIVVIVVGYPGSGSPAPVSGAFKDLRFVRDWAALLTAAGLAVITYTNRAPADDLSALLTHIASHGENWGVDLSRIGLFAQSGNVPVALSALMGRHAIRPICAAFTYGFMFDAPGTTAVADAAKAFGFANPCAGRTIDDVDPAVQVLIVRAGRDQFPGLNGSIDTFVADALVRNRPVSVVNLPEAPHAFDLVDDSRPARDAIRQVIAFMRASLTA